MNSICQSHQDAPDSLCPRCRFIVLYRDGRQEYEKWMRAYGHALPHSQLIILPEEAKQPDLIAAVRALRDQWRDSANGALRLMEKKPEYISARASAEMLLKCADELDALLTGAGEAP